MAMGESATTIGVRREGFVIPWDGLTQDQKLVVERAAEMLAAMSKESEPPRKATGPSFLPAIDQSRTNRVLFIDGKRGSGKSSVLVSIIDSYSELIRDTQSEGTPGYRSVIRRDANVVPIGLLDLDPLQGVSNLLLQVITCFSEVVRAVCGGTEAPSRSILDEAPTQKLLIAWQQLRQMVARTWVSPSVVSGSVHAREQVWNQLEIADERARVHSVFSSFMDLLCDEYAVRYRVRSPMFVMAFDDVDMNAELSPGLLSIVRSFRHSRLAFVLTGDGDLLLRRVAAAVSDDEPEFSRTRPLKSRSSVLAEEVVRKVIPYNQRLILRELAVFERIDLLPELRAGLDGVVCSYRGQRESLLSKVRRYERPSGASFLPDRLRELVDFSSSVIGRRDAKALLPVLVERWSVLAGREGLRSPVLSYDSVGGVALVDPSDLKIQIAAEYRHKYPIDALRNAELSVFREYRLQIAGATVSASLSALFFLVLDLLTEDEELGSGVDGWLYSQRNPKSAAQVTVTLPRGWVRCEWPSIHWLRMVEYQSFMSRWEQTIGLAGRGEFDHDKMLRAFLGLILDHCEDPTRSGRAEFSAESWEQLGVRVGQLFEQRSPRQPDLFRWLVRDSLLFASPELCPNEAGAQAYLFALSRSPLFGSMVTMAKAARLEWYSAVRNGPEGEVLAEGMREFAPSHPWWDFVDSVSKANPDHVRRLNAVTEIMERAPIQFKEFGASRLSLANYVTESRRKLMLQGGLVGLERAESALSALKSVSRWSGSALHSIMALWKSLSDDGTVSGWLSIENDGLKFSVLARKTLAAIRAFYARRVGRSESEEFSQVGRVELSRVPDPALRFIPQISPAAEAVLRIAWDYESDRRDAAADQQSSSIRWPHCRFRIDGASLYPWPVPNWPQIWPWERYGEIWNGIVDSDRNVVSHTNANIPADALALALIRATVAWPVLMSGSDSVDWTWQEGLAAAVRQAADQLKEPPDGGRLRMVYREWLENLILFATPEAGLAPQVAEQFIAVLRPVMLKLHGVEGILVRRRNLNAAIPDVAKLLARIDRQNSSHPWVVAFGRDEN